MNKYSQRKQRGNKKFWLWLIILFLALVLTVYILTAVFFDIKEVVINQEESKNEVLKFVEDASDQNILIFAKARNIFLFPKNKIENLLADKFLSLDDFIIKKDYLERKIFVDYNTREAMGIYCYTNQCLNFDRKGILFKETLRSLGNNSLFLKTLDLELKLGNKIENFNYFVDLRQWLEKLDLNVKELLIKSNIRWELSIATDNTKNDDKIKSWQLILDPTIYEPRVLVILLAEILNKIDNQENIDYIDMRIENRVYYK